MKVCILSAVNIKHMSLISLYTNILKERGIEYDIVYMDKYGDDEYFECKHKYRFVNVVKHDLPKFVKAALYMRFRGYAKRILNKENYDFVIVWNDVAIFMFSYYLARKYKGKYCLNVRDNEKYDKKWTKFRYKKAFSNSAFNTISSLGYKVFLPDGVDYIPVHSFNSTALEGMKVHDGIRKEGEPIRIGFIGYIRFFERNQKLLDVFKNDPRFIICFYGKKANELKRYAEENGITNVDFHDSFPVEDTKIYLEKIDIINNLYGNETVNLRKAISIKFYHALYSRIPILVSNNTYQSETAQKAGIGFEISEINEETKENLYKWYRNLDFDIISENCANFLEQAKKDNQVFKETVIKWMK